MNDFPIYDLHTHSVNSFDGRDSCLRLCEAAQERGIRGIAITDHLDIDGKDLDVRTYTTNQFMQCEIAKNYYKDSVEVFSGIELGQGIYRKKLSEEVLTTIDYDFVLGSIHNPQDDEDYFFMDFTKEDVPARLQAYFESELALAAWDKTDSLAHLTYPLRYIVGKHGIEVDITPYDEIIDTIFETLIKNHKALELNVSTLFNYHLDTMPNKRYIKRFKELGGKYVTVGTDAHVHEKVGVGIDTGYEILRECGFDNVTVFRKREPILIDIR